MSEKGRFKRTLLTGLFVIGPFSLTFILLAWFVSTVNRAVAPLADLIGYPIPGLGLAAAFLIILAAGALANNIAGQHLIEFVEEIALKVPVFNWLYRTIKQVADAFGPTKKAAFRRVVLVEYPRPEIYSVGFVTNELSLEKDGQGRPLTCVFIPTNHMYIGDFILAPSERVIATSLTLQEGIQVALSAGASLPPVIRPQGPAAHPEKSG